MQLDSDSSSTSPFSSGVSPAPSRSQQFTHCGPPLLLLSTISARLRVEFPRPAALLLNIYAWDGGFGLRRRIFDIRAIQELRYERRNGATGDILKDSHRKYWPDLRKSFTVGLGSGD